MTQGVQEKEITITVKTAGGVACEVVMDTTKKILTTKSASETVYRHDEPPVRHEGR